MDYLDIFERSPNPYMILDRGLRYVAVNRAYESVVGRTRDVLLGVGLFEAFPGDGTRLGETNVALLRQSIERVFATGERDVLSLIRYAIERPDEAGPVMEDRYWSATHTPLFDSAGRVAHVLQHTTDVTHLQRLNQALARATGASQEQIEFGMFERARKVQEHNRALEHRISDLETLFAQAPGFMAYLSGPEHRFTLANRAYETLVGRDRDLIGRVLEEALPETAEQGFLALLDEVYRSGRPYVGQAVPLLLQREPDAEPEELVVDFVYQPVKDAGGQVVGIFVQGNDMTAQVAAQAEVELFHNNLAELVEQRTQALKVSEEERLAAQAALHQSQKLEAIGQLTGGVAHDFNNLLQVIGANLELLEGQVQDSVASQRLASARNAVQRGAQLVSQLMAFARRDPLNVAVFDPALTLSTLADMLERTLGEGREIALELDLDCETRIRTNPQQFETAILNIVINARHAMPHGGKVRIECRCVDGAEAGRGGEHVRITIADTGTGMAPEVVEHIFEPFFTTKPQGEGTGLGLAAVYGFIQQSGGEIRVDSVPGEGSRFTLYLPTTDAPGEPVVDPADSTPRGRNEVVLLVEDDEGVRRTGVDMLFDLGYDVVQASHAAMGRALLDEGLRPALLFSDVVMPGPMHSFDLVAHVQARLPGTAVLMTSGYAEATLSRSGAARPDVPMLAKPYTRADLGRHVRAAIDGHRLPPSLRVLLVEDNDDDRLLTSELLEACGMDVAHAGSANEALQKLAASPRDVLLTDVELPGCDGIELAREACLRQPGLCVVFVTGHDEEAVRERGGVGAILSKPFSRAQLTSAIALATQALDTSPAPAG